VLANPTSTMCLGIAAMLLLCDDPSPTSAGAAGVDGTRTGSADVKTDAFRWSPGQTVLAVD